MGKTNEINLTRRRLACRIAETVEAVFKRPGSFDVDLATDLIDAILPATRAEAEAEIDAILAEPTEPASEPSPR